MLELLFWALVFVKNTYILDIEEILLAQLLTRGNLNNADLGGGVAGLRYEIGHDILSRGPGEIFNSRDLQ